MQTKKSHDVLTQKELKQIKKKIKKDLITAKEWTHLNFKGLTREEQQVAYNLYLLGKELAGKHKLALKRIKTGEYGLCSKCGEFIGRDRLKACPSADKCLKHQKEEEQQ